MFDAYPGQMLLDISEVAQLMGMKVRTFRRFLADNPSFPKPIAAGMTKAKGRGAASKPPVPRARWRKWEVLAWLMMQPTVGDAHLLGTDEDK